MSRRVLVACATVAVVLVGCGGGDSGPSESEFREALAESCENFNEERAELDEFKGESGFLDRYADLVDELDDELADLEAPSDLEDPLEELQEVVDEAKDLLRDIDRGLEDLDTDVILGADARMDDLADDAADVADEIGVDECALDLGFGLDLDDDEDQADDDEPATEPSTADFDSALEEVCAGIAASAAGLVPPSSDTDFAGLVQFTVATRAMVQSALSALEVIEPPTDVAEDYEDFLHVLDQQVGALQELERAAEAEDVATIDALELELETFGRESDDLADEFDLDRCASGG